MKCPSFFAFSPSHLVAFRVVVVTIIFLFGFVRPLNTRITIQIFLNKNASHNKHILKGREREKGFQTNN